MERVEYSTWPFFKQKGVLKCYCIKGHSLLPRQCKNCHSVKVNICPSVKVKICYSSKCQVYLPINAIHYILPLMLLLSNMWHESDMDTTSDVSEGTHKH